MDFASLEGARPVPLDAPDFARMRRVLVVKLRYHGDVLLSSPVFHVLKRNHPHLEIDALVYRDTAPMLSGHPAVARVHCIEKRDPGRSLGDRLRAERALYRELRLRNYDLLVHLTEHWRGPLLKRLLGIRWAVAARYRRRDGWFWRTSFTHHYPVPVAPRHKAESHLDALRRLGVHPPTDTDRRLHLHVDAADAASARAKRHAAGLPDDGYVLVHPSSRFAYKCWDAVRMARLIDRLHEAGERVLLTCAPDAGERAMVEHILGLCRRPPASLAGALTLKELAACIAAARLFAGVDSAPMHMAAALGVPVVALFGPSSAQVWGPWMVPHRVVRSGHACQPCQLRGCGDSLRSDCLASLEVDAVWAALVELLGGPRTRTCALALTR